MEVTTAKEAVRLARELKKRKARSDEGLFLLEGFHLVEEAIRCGLEIVFLILSPRATGKMRGRGLLSIAEREGIPSFFVNERKFELVAETDTPQGVIAVCRRRYWSESELLQRPQGFYLALDQLQDPGNLGTIIRSADAAGADGVLLGKGTVDLYNSKVLRSTMGSAFRLPVLEGMDLVELLPGLKEKGVRVVAADPHGRDLYFHAALNTRPLLLLVGNEGRGIDPALLELSDQRLRIPLHHGVESLNAAVAAALILYESLRQESVEG